MAWPITPDTMAAHRARWFVYSGGERMPHTSTMRGHWPGWDVTCQCGWDSGTGGATRGSVAQALFEHRFSEQVEADHVAAG